MLADMAKKIEAARLLVDYAATLAETGQPYSKAAAMAKCFASDTAMEVTTDAMQIFGGYGYCKEYPVEKLFRDAKINQIVEGTNQIQRIVIGRSVIADGGSGNALITG
jgi:alkylation response protein AidB-like acyl-CoA dehydrogenase